MASLVGLEPFEALNRLQQIISPLDASKLNRSFIVMLTKAIEQSGQKIHLVLPNARKAEFLSNDRGTLRTYSRLMLPQLLQRLRHPAEQIVQRLNAEFPWLPEAIDRIGDELRISEQY